MVALISERAYPTSPHAHSLSYSLMLNIAFPDSSKLLLETLKVLYSLYPNKLNNMLEL